MADCGCPVGYEYDIETDTCIETLTVAAICSGTTYPVAAGDQVWVYSSEGANFYGDITNAALPLDENWAAFVLRDANLVDLPVLQNVQNNLWGELLVPEGASSAGRLWEAGIWTGEFAGYPLDEWIGFSVCLSVPVTGTYSLGFGSDNKIKLAIDGNPIVEIGVGGVHAYAYWSVVDIQLEAGDHIINIEGLNTGGAAAIAAEIYNADYATLAAMTTIPELEAVIEWSTKDLVGVANFDSGEDSGCNCPEGYTLSSCGGELECVQINTVAPDECPCYIATDCADNTNVEKVNHKGPPLDTELVHKFVQFPGKCWTVVASDCSVPNEPDLLLNTGFIDAEDTLGSRGNRDFNWKLVEDAAGIITPIQAYISDQNWYDGVNPPGTPPSYGTLPENNLLPNEALWITQFTPHLSYRAPGDKSYYELEFDLPENYVPTIEFDILSDNTAKVYLNGNLIANNTGPEYPNAWYVNYSFSTSDPANFVPQVLGGPQVLRVEITDSESIGSSNGFNLRGSLKSIVPQVPAMLVNVEEVFPDCKICIDPVPPSICWDLEVQCDDTCDDVLAINSFDFTPFIGQNITVLPQLTDDNCWYRPYALRQSAFYAAPPLSGDWGYDLNILSSDFQQGLDDITITIDSFIFNGTEYIVGAAPSTLLTPANIQFVYCVGFQCDDVPINNPDGLTGYSNAVDFINDQMALLGITAMQASNNSYDACPVCTDQGPSCDDSIGIQYRDGDTFELVMSFANIAEGTQTVLHEVRAGNVSICNRRNSFDVDYVLELPACNDYIYCPTPVDSEPIITSAVVMGDCIPPLPPAVVGEACEIVPRLGEPGFSVKNCDPKTVINVKTKYADAVYALFKRMRYGIETCCEFDLDKIDIKNQLIDLGAIYDPELCVEIERIIDCCIQPTNANVTLCIPAFLACDAPTLASASIALPACGTWQYNNKAATPTGNISGLYCGGEPFTLNIALGDNTGNICIIEGSISYDFGIIAIPVGAGCILPLEPECLIAVIVTNITTTSATATTSGTIVGPISYLWSNGETTETAVNLIAGTEYTVTVYDDGVPGCVATDSISTPPLVPVCGVTIYITDITETGATAVVGGQIVGQTNIVWSNGESGAIAVNLLPGQTYTAMVLDDGLKGCTAIAEVTMPEAPALAIGDCAHGGFVFYLDGNGGGLVAAVYDAEAIAGCDKFAYRGDTNVSVPPTSPDLGDGLQNTLDIVALFPVILQPYAANEALTHSNRGDDISCGGIFNDFYLPSRDELETMRVNLMAVGDLSIDFNFISSVDAFACDGPNYWSSTIGGDNANTMVAAGGPLTLNQNTKNAYVRAIRSF